MLVHRQQLPSRLMMSETKDPDMEEEKLSKIAVQVALFVEIMAFLLALH